MAEQDAGRAELAHVEPSPMDDSTTEYVNTEQLQNLSLSPKKPSVQTHADAPPPPPQKDEVYIDPTPKTPQAPRSPLGLPAEYTEKELPNVPQNSQPGKGKEAANVNKTDDGGDGGDDQSEIQSIMEQFSNETEGPKETDIMSPRLELAEQRFMVSTRRSSLEPPPPKSTAPIPSPIIVPKSSQSFPTDAPGTPQSTSSRTGLPPPEPEPDQPFDFHRFLEQLRHRTADPVAKFLRSFLTEFGKKQWQVHEQVKIISDFLAFITNKMAQCEVWRHVSDAEFDNAKEGMEKLVMNRLYGQTFSPAIPPPPSVPRSASRSKRREMERMHGPGRRGQHQEDVERDEILAQKIRIYSWIRPEHLDIPSLGNNGRRFITLAQQGMPRRISVGVFANYYRTGEDQKL
jgi:Rab5 GDP/GTP exchange factor